MVLHAGVKGVSERSELTPCIYILQGFFQNFAPVGANTSCPNIREGASISYIYTTKVTVIVT